MGPLHWSSKLQTITATISAESEIYATDECIKYIQYLHHTINELNLKSIIIPNTINIYNDNRTCVDWSETTTTKGLRHITIRENAVRESIETGLVEHEHIQGLLNVSDIFTKEDKDINQFIQLHDILVSDPFQPTPFRALLHNC